MLSVGPHKGTILSHRSKMLGDKIAISILCQVGNEEVEAIVFITDKAMGMARRALKCCGFDVDATDLVMLDVQPELLKGREVPLICRMWNGKPQIGIDIDGRAEKSVLADATKKLREVKKVDAEPAAYDGEHGSVPF
jgi:hypothetical protein